MCQFNQQPAQSPVLYAVTLQAGVSGSVLPERRRHDAAVGLGSSAQRSERQLPLSACLWVSGGGPVSPRPDSAPPVAGRKDSVRYRSDRL